MMTDPVVAADGYSYESANIARWLKSSRSSPLTGKELEHVDLTPNFALRSSIHNYLEKFDIELNEYRATSGVTGYDDNDDDHEHDDDNAKIISTLKNKLEKSRSQCSPDNDQSSDMYDGEMLGNRKHGQGTYKWKDGDRYTGEWFEDRMHGRGVFVYANGDKYEGEFSSGLKQGKGVFYWSLSAHKYVGEWYDDQMNGFGLFWHASGDTYEGEFRNGLKHGKGTYRSASSGYRYVGEWRKDQRTGEGVSIRDSFAVVDKSVDDRHQDNNEDSSSNQDGKRFQWTDSSAYTTCNVKSILFISKIFVSE